MRFRSARRGASHQFSGPKNWYRPGPWVDYGKSKKIFCVGSQNRDDPIVGSALRTRILAIPGGSKSAYLSTEILIFRQGLI